MELAAFNHNITVIGPEQIGAWLAAAIAKAVKADVADIDYDIAFDRFGLDSVSAVEMTRELSAWLNEELAPTLLYDYPTIDLLSAHLASQVRSANV